MTTHLLITRKFENLHQELDCLRGRPVNPSLDIDLPTYIVDYAIISAIKRDSASYLADYLRKYPSHIYRFFYQETGVPQKPTRKMITICPLLHYALRSNALECIRVLIQRGASAFQPSYVIEWAVTRGGDSKIEIVEKQTIAWLAELILENVIEYSAKVLNHFKQSNVDFTKPLETRVQRINLKNPIPTKTIQYDDVWHCIEKIIEKICPQEDLNNRKRIMKKLRSGFAMDTLENIIKKRKIEEPKKPTEGEPEKLQDKDV
ncbi:unnamed protein product [Hymenolepis diminuta]|uniref:ANK_REP_REGION domain-containing protein n=1 Tax=Hymenolepis diminuta TaxID=6216 RepID=A0A0R3SES8_HYMDI|nr:unnamed protein product [Hymenolepis diminuta]VUZ45435.1 unnamed protein product [Hymenolepis diminuta]